MKVAIVLMTRWWRGSIDHDGYATAIRALGHVPVLVCLGNDAGDADFEVVVASQESQATVSFWRDLDVDVAVVWNWLRGSQLLQTLRQANVKIAIRGDTDGILSKRVFPCESFWRIVDTGGTLRNRIGLAKYFALQAWPSAKEEDAELIATVDYADAVIVETPTAMRGLERILSFYNEEQYLPKISVVPHSIRDAFVMRPITNISARRRQVIAAGRWDSSQKNPELLLETLRRLLASDPSVVVVVCGPIKHEIRVDLLRLGERIAVLGKVPLEQMIHHLVESQVFLSTSRWETQPIGAMEAICLGCRVVAPPIRGFIDLLADSQLGRLAGSSKPGDLAATVRMEMQAIDRGDCKSEVLAANYRQRVNNMSVVSEILTSVMR